MTLGAFLQPWSRPAFRHIPASSPFGVLDFRFAGRSADNRWNEPGEPTVYLASDRGVALAELARHFHEAPLPPSGLHLVERAIFRLEVAVEALIDMRDPGVHRALSLMSAPHCFLDRGIARATAQFPRPTTAAQALLAPSMAFLDAPERWVLVLFLDKLPADHRRFITAVEAAGTFRVGA